MTGDNHGNIVAFSSKIAVEQAGDETGMSPSQARDNRQESSESLHRRNASPGRFHAPRVE